MSNKLLEVDYDKKLFEIVITVCHNGNKLEVNVTDEKIKPTYQEIIGALEISKTNFIVCQSNANRTAEEKKKKPKNKKLWIQKQY